MNTTKNYGPEKIPIPIDEQKRSVLLDEQKTSAPVSEKKISKLLNEQKTPEKTQKKYLPNSNSNIKFIVLILLLLFGIPAFVLSIYNYLHHGVEKVKDGNNIKLTGSDVEPIISLKDNVKIPETLSVSGDTRLLDDLTVTGGTSLLGGLSVTSGLCVLGDTILSGDLTVTGNTVLEGFGLDGDTEIDGTLTVTGGTSLLGGLSVTSGLCVLGDTILSGSLDVFGVTVLNDDLLVNNFGDTTLTGNFSAGSGSFTVDQSANTTINSSLHVFGPAVFESDLAVYSGASISGYLTVSDGASITSLNTTEDVDLFNTTTGKITLGNGPVDISAPGASTTVKGSLVVDEVLFYKHPVEFISSNKTLLESESGKTIFVNNIGYTVTLPELTSDARSEILFYKFRIHVVGRGVTITTGDTSILFHGHVNESGNTSYYKGSDNKSSVEINAFTSEGDFLEIYSAEGKVWHVHGSAHNASVFDFQPP